MLESIKASIFQKYKQEDQKGLFFSLYDANKNLLTSNGVMITDKPLSQLIEILYHGIVEKYPTTKSIEAHIIQDLILASDIANLLTVSPKENGLFLIQKDKAKSGVILPGTPEAKDIKTAITLIKEKFNLSGDVEIYTFKTDKIMISK